MFTHRRLARVSRTWGTSLRLRITRRAGSVPAGRVVTWLIAAAVVVVAQPVLAHGIVGNRLFPGTLAFDDPAVNDELIFPALSSLKHPGDGGDVTDTRVGSSFTRLLTSTVAIGIERGWVHRNWPSAQRSGFDETNLTIKGLLYKNELHEVMLSAGLAWGIGGTGDQGVGANKPNTLQPGIFFGKGFGDLPDGLAWLRPLGITGAVTLEHPMTGMSTNLGIDADTGQLSPMLSRNVDVLHWGFSLQFSTYYLSPRFTPGKLPKEEPLHQLVPIIEFAFNSPRGEKTAATINPGLAYVAGAWQVAAEAIIPLNSEGGRSVGARAQLLLFLDDLIPSVFGRPLLDSIVQSPRQGSKARP